MKKILLLGTLACIIISCGNKGDKSTKFEGNWRAVDWESSRVHFGLSVRKVDKNFTIKVFNLSKDESIDSTSSRPLAELLASYNKENDKLDVSAGVVDASTVIYDSKTNHIICYWGEMEKVK